MGYIRKVHCTHLLCNVNITFNLAINDIFNKKKKKNPFNIYQKKLQLIQTKYLFIVRKNFFFFYVMT